MEWVMKDYYVIIHQYEMVGEMLFMIDADGLCYETTRIVPKLPSKFKKIF